MWHLSYGRHFIIFWKTALHKTGVILLTWLYGGVCGAGCFRSRRRSWSPAGCLPACSWSGPGPMPHWCPARYLGRQPAAPGKPCCLHRDDSYMYINTIIRLSHVSRRFKLLNSVKRQRFEQCRRYHIQNIKLPKQHNEAVDGIKSHRY